MTEVYRRVQPGPATYALVIGVGEYPHLPGGSGARTRADDGMTQLGSPTLSARVVADWLIDSFNNTNTPLASVRLLLSDANSQVYIRPGSTVAIPVDAADHRNVKAAARDWFADGNSDEDNLLIFYFCGHGISEGTDYALILRDYGATDANPLEGALDFRKLHLGMDTCKAAEQAYFIDACRLSSDTLIGSSGHAGEVPILPGIRNNALRPREASIFYATLGGQQAYAKPNKPSVFANALIKSLNGAGADDSEGDWRVDTTSLHRALDFYMDEENTPKVQVPQSASHSTFFLHYLLSEPEVPVVVSCDPVQAIADADLTCTQLGNVVHNRPAIGSPDPAAWNLELLPGGYDFTATFSRGAFRGALKSDYVRPTYRRIKLGVQP